MAQLNVLGRNLKSLSRHHVCSGYVKYVMTSRNWSQPSFQFVLAVVESRPDVCCCDRFLLFLTIDVMTTISCCDLTVLLFAEIYVATSISCRDIISVASYVDLCCDHVFLAP